MHGESLKPKVICKNLQDIIRDSMHSTKRNSVEEPNKKQSSQRILRSQPRQRRSNERCNTSVNGSNRLFESGVRLNTSVSKHSLESKEKINLLAASKTLCNVNLNRTFEPKINRNAIGVASSAVDFYASSQKNTNKQTTFSVPTPQNHTKSLYFNQIDAIFTELEDFIREIREKVCLRIDFLNEENTADRLANELGELSSLFRSELMRLVEGSVYQEGEVDVLKPKNRTFEREVNPVNKSKAGSGAKEPHQNTKFQEQLIKIQEFIRRQNTINSTINSQPHQDPYLATQTDAQLLSMLVYKNKICNTKRKIQNTFGHGQEMWVKSGRGGKEQEGEYSFRTGNGREGRERDLACFSNVGTEVGIKKKKGKNVASEKSVNKENRQSRQRSIYQMVLEENRKSKGGWAK